VGIKVENPTHGYPWRTLSGDNDDSGDDDDLKDDGDSKGDDADDSKESSVILVDEVMGNEEDDIGKMVIQFAHFSVKEYLTFNRIVNRLASNYQICKS
jgi:hypothetical protein